MTNAGGQKAGRSTDSYPGTSATITRLTSHAPIINSPVVGPLASSNKVRRKA